MKSTLIKKLTDAGKCIRWGGKRKASCKYDSIRLECVSGTPTAACRRPI